MSNLFNLTYFDGDTGETPSNNTAEAEASAEIEVGAQTEEAEVKYGVQPESSQEEADESSKNEQFGYKQFKKQFKDEFQSDIQRIIDKRFKNSKKVEAQRDELLARNEAFDSLLSVLGERYGTDDLEQLIGEITNDDSFLLSKAQQENMSVENFKRLDSARREALAYKSELESVKAQMQQQAIVEKWQKDARALSEIYPEFNLEEEIDNERFSTALQNGMDMRDAYQYAHFDEILNGAIKRAALDVKSAVEQSRAQRASRPLENGINSTSAAVVKNDVSKLSKSDMEEIDRLVLRGERISF